MIQHPNPEEIEEALKEILKKLGYTTSSPEKDYFPADGVSTFALKFILIIIVLVILIYFVLQLISRPHRVVAPRLQQEKEERELIERKDYFAFYKKAVEIGKKGDYLEAVRTLYMALLILLDSKQVIVYHPWLTNFEYRQAVKGCPFSARFEAVTRLFDTVYYGARNATGSDFSRVMEAFTEIEEAVS